MDSNFKSESLLLAGDTKESFSPQHDSFATPVDDELDANTTGWALALLNPVLRNNPTLLACIVSDVREKRIATDLMSNLKVSNESKKRPVAVLLSDSTEPDARKIRATTNLASDLMFESTQHPKQLNDRVVLRHNRKHVVKTYLERAALDPDVTDIRAAGPPRSRSRKAAIDVPKESRNADVTTNAASLENLAAHADKWPRSRRSTHAPTMNKELRVSFGDPLDLDAILDPVKHYQDLDGLEGQIHKLCRCHLDGLDGIIDGLGAVRESIDLMQSTGFCGADIVVLMIGRESQVKAVSIAISDILSFCLLVSEQLTHDAQLGLVKLDPLMAKLLLHFDLYPDRAVLLLTTNDNSNIARAILQILLISLMGYAGGWCSDRHFLAAPARADFKPFPGLHNILTNAAAEIQVTAARISCMADHIGGDVLALNTGRIRHMPRANIRISLSQLADMWGPAYVIRDDIHFNRIIAICLDGGILYRTTAQGSASNLFFTHLHFMKLDTTWAHRVSKSIPHRLLKSLRIRSKDNSRLPAHLLPFRADAQFEIGFDGILGMSNTCRSQPENVAAEAQKLRPLGTHGSYLACEQLQLNFSAGQYVNFGVQKSWKRRPATSWKTSLLEYCTRRRQGFDAILALNIGLEVSLCTGNARRVSIRRALEIALNLNQSSEQSHEQSINTMSASEASAILNGLYDLAHTGVGPDRKLRLFWPNNGHEIPEVYIPDKPPVWQALIADTHDSACFGTVSFACLTYPVADSWMANGVKKLTTCNGPRVDRRFQMLETIIQDSQCGKDDSERPCWHVVLLADKRLEVVARHKSDLLATYPAVSWHYRLNSTMSTLIASCAAGTSHKHRELFNLARHNPAGILRLGILHGRAPVLVELARSGKKVSSLSAVDARIKPYTSQSQILVPDFRLENAGAVDTVESNITDQASSIV